MNGLTDEDLRAEYWAADLLFLPLIDATANNAVLEAMACGLPVVSTAVGGAPELLGESAGLLCPRGDCDAMVAAVQALARDPARRLAAGEAGRSRAQSLCWQGIGEMHHQLYRSLLARR